MIHLQNSSLPHIHKDSVTEKKKGTEVMMHSKQAMLCKKAASSLSQGRVLCFPSFLLHAEKAHAEMPGLNRLPVLTMEQPEAKLCTSASRPRRGTERGWTELSDIRTQ